MNIILRGALAAILGTLPVLGTRADETYVTRDRNGNRTGELRQEGSRWVERDTNGNPKSYYIKQGDRTEHRTMDGRLLGTSEKH